MIHAAIPTCSVLSPVAGTDGAGFIMWSQRHDFARALERERVIALAVEVAFFGPFQARALPAGTLHGPVCGAELSFAFETNRRLAGDMAWPAPPRPASRCGR